MSDLKLLKDKISKLKNKISFDEAFFNSQYQNVMVLGEQISKSYDELELLKKNYMVLNK